MPHHYLRVLKFRKFRRCDITEINADKKIIKYVSYVFGALSFIIPLIIFFKTMAPTLSFWDCGEFIAASNILGNPHPPGFPLFILIGKFFIQILFFVDSIAARTNIISVLSSALCAFVMYMLVVRISQRMPFGNKGSEFLGQIGIRIGAFSSALIMAFSSTFWFNAVETETYGLPMFIMILTILLAVKWADEKEAGYGSDKYIVFITYLLYLSIGIHLTGFLVVPAFVLFFVIVDKTKMKDPLFWITWAILFSVAVPAYFIIAMIIPWVQNNAFLIWIILMFAGLIATGYFAYTNRNKKGQGRFDFNLAFVTFLVAIIGYSTHIYIPIRASYDPVINENDPSTWSSFVGFLERKQYGQESMISRMFYRRGQLSNQFGDHENMGFGGYFMEQYASDTGFNLLRIFLFALGFFGLITGGYYALQKFKFHPSILVFILFLLGSVMLVFYMNFADGTRPDPNNPGNYIQLEVRERDYFFTPGFILFAGMIGLGMSSLLYLIANGIKFGKDKAGETPRNVVFGVVALAFLLIPINTVKTHYKSHDRARDYVPVDYAWNILQSCEKDAILFTNGDNDTFPLWYLQEVEGIRKDVRIANLSLLNTDWYILQLKDLMGINMFLEDDEIKWIPADVQGSLIYYRPAKKFFDRVRKKMRYLTPEQDRRTGKVMRVQDQMIEQISIANFDKPIYFSGSVPLSNRWTLNDFLIREGIVLKVDPDTTKPRYNLAVSDSLITQIYRYRGLGDLNAYKDGNNVGLTTTFPERFCELSNNHLAAGDSARALEILNMAVETVPYYHQTYINLERIYTALGDSVMADSSLNLGIKLISEAADEWPDLILYQQFLGVLFYQNDMADSALVRYKNAYTIKPDNSIAFRLYRDLFLQTIRVKDDKNLRTPSPELSEELASLKEEFRELLDDWNGRHPEDTDARSFYQRFRNIK
jgi:tetratricopeptide (TPR) repeat protein